MALVNRFTDEQFNVAMVIPLQGSAGIFGPSCEAAANIAVADINARGGILGREVNLTVVDGGAKSSDVVRSLATLARRGQVDAVTGWHISSVREAIKPLVSMYRIPYVYTSLYEGGETTAGIFCSGEVPQLQIAPALSWFQNNLGVTRWTVIGNDYVWPRKSVTHVRQYSAELGLTITRELFVPFGTHDFSRALASIRADRPDGILMLLVGQDGVRFNRQFAASGIDETTVRFTPLLEENMLMAGGLNATKNTYVAASYFSSMASAGALDFMGSYVDKNGPTAPRLNNMAESCYEGVLFLQQLLRASGTHEFDTVCAAAETLGYEGPRGSVSMKDGVLRQPVQLASTDSNDFDIICTLEGVGC